MDYNEYKIDKIKRSTKNKILISIIVGVLLIVCSCVGVFVSKLNDNREDVSKFYNDKTSLTGDVSFLTVCVNDDNKLSFLALIKAQLYNKTFYVTMLDCNQKVNLNGSDLSLNDHYISGGIHKLCEGVKFSTESEISKYIVIKEDNLPMIFGELGHIVTDIPSDIKLKVSEGVVNIPKGRQELDYEEISDYLLNGCKADNKLSFQGDFICEIMQQYIENADYSNSADTFGNLINYIETDISVVDYTDNQDIIMSFENSDFAFVNTLNK